MPVACSLTLTWTPFRRLVPYLFFFVRARPLLVISLMLQHDIVKRKKERKKEERKKEKSCLLGLISTSHLDGLEAGGSAMVLSSPLHIILMLVDELGTGDLPWSDPLIYAPTIKALGEGGLRLGHQYAWHWCAPTRGALMTGRLPMHSGYTGGGMPGDGEGVDLRLPLLPGELKTATPAYATHMLGKYHLGFRTHANLPTSRGFDSFFGLLAGGADHYNNALEACGGDGERCRCKGSNHSSTKLPFRIDFTDGDAPAKELWDETTYDAYQFGARAVKLVEQHDATQPFFLYWAPHKVHSPLQAPPEFLAHYPDGDGKCSSTPQTCSGRGYGTSNKGCGCKNMCYCNRRIVRGMVTAVDAMLTNLTSALKANADMWNNTLVILLGDNGGPVNNANYNTEFKGQKFGHWEGGHRVPCFIGGPALEKLSGGSQLAGRWYNETVHLVDLHATVLDLAGVEASHPADVAAADGFSLLPLLNGSRPLSTVLRPNNGELWIMDDVLRIGDYKLITGQGTAQIGNGGCSMLGLGGLPVGLPRDPKNLSTFCGPVSKCHGNETGGDALICSECKCTSYSPIYNATATGAAKCVPCVFNVRSDPGETINLAAMLDKPEEVKRLATMTARLVELRKSTVHPTYPPNDDQAACDAMVAAGGFFVPWAEE